MIIVSDTTAITSLLQIGQAEILRELFQTVYIPPAVQHELLSFHATLPEFLLVAIPANRVDVERFQTLLDAGEAEAIALAKEKHADALLMDEKIGREVATREGIPLIGLLGVLIKAKQNGLIASVRQSIADLELKADFRISAQLKERVLLQAGEL